MQSHSVCARFHKSPPQIFKISVLPQSIPAALDRSSTSALDIGRSTRRRSIDARLSKLSVQLSASSGPRARAPAISRAKSLCAESA